MMMWSTMAAHAAILAVRRLLDALEDAGAAWSASGRPLPALAILCRGTPAHLQSLLPVARDDLLVRIRAIGRAVRRIADELAQTQGSATPVLFYPRPGTSAVVHLAWVDLRQAAPQGFAPPPVPQDAARLDSLRKRIAIHEAGHVVVDLAGEEAIGIVRARWAAG